MLRIFFSMYVQKNLYDGTPTPDMRRPGCVMIIATLTPLRLWCHMNNSKSCNYVRGRSEGWQPTDFFVTGGLVFSREMTLYAKRYYRNWLIHSRRKNCETNGKRQFWPPLWWPPVAQSSTHVTKHGYNLMIVIIMQLRIACNYLSMPGLKLNHASIRDLCFTQFSNFIIYVCFGNLIWAKSGLIMISSGYAVCQCQCQYYHIVIEFS